MKKITLPLIALAFAATGAQAQDVPAAPSAPTTTESLPQDALSPADATPQAAPDASAVTDAEVSSYVQAATKVQEIAKDAALPDATKQQQMASAVSEAGLAPQRFNEISQAISADAELRARIQTAMTAHSAAHDG